MRRPPTTSAARRGRRPYANGFILINRAMELKPALNVIIVSAHFDENDGMAKQVVEHYAHVTLSKSRLAETVIVAVDSVLGSDV